MISNKSFDDEWETELLAASANASDLRTIHNNCSNDESDDCVNGNLPGGKLTRQWSVCSENEVCLCSEL